jgi:hypothetical protein
MPPPSIVSSLVIYKIISRKERELALIEFSSI